MDSQNAETTNSPDSQLVDSNPDPLSSDELNHDLSPPTDDDHDQPSATQDILVDIPGAIINLIDQQYSVELASGNFSIIRLCQGDNVVAVFARVADEVQWPLANDVTAVKVDDSHYFFSFRVPKDSGDDDDSTELLSYGLTIASEGEEDLLKDLDSVLDSCCSFSASEAEMEGKSLNELVEEEYSGKELVESSSEKKELMERQCAAYWTTLAPNVEDYSGSAAKLVARGSGKVVKGILRCGDLTIWKMKRGNNVLKRKINSAEKVQISPKTLKRIKRVKKVTKMTDKVANGVLSGVITVSGLLASSVVNSTVGKKFFSLLPGEIMLASLDGFNKVCEALEVTGKNVVSTSSTMATELVQQRYGEEAAEATSEGLSAAGHALGTAWAAVRIKKVLTTGGLKPTSLVKSGAKAAVTELVFRRTK